MNNRTYPSPYKPMSDSIVAGDPEVCIYPMQYNAL